MAMNRIGAALLLALLVSVQADAQSRPSGVALGSICHFFKGPRLGESQDYAPRVAPVGSHCQDGAGSEGTIIEAADEDAESVGGSADGASGEDYGGGDGHWGDYGGQHDQEAEGSYYGNPMRVSEIRPYYWKRNQREPAAAFYFYLLFGQAGDPTVELSALRAVVCDLHKSPILLPPTIPDKEAPLLMPVVADFNAMVGVRSTEAELRRFRNESYDDKHAEAIMQHLGLPDGNVYLVASRKPIHDLPAGAATSANADYRPVYIDRTDPYEGIAMRSIIAETYAGVLFNGDSSRDVGYAVVSFVYKLGAVVANVVPSAQATTSQDAADDRGICQ